jgi:flavin-dependent dehydrogenase
MTLAEAEVVICGAGPPGSALAALLAKAGVDVLLIDRQEVPGFSVGESLLPFGNRVLEAIGVRMDGFQQKDGAVFTLDEDGGSEPGKTMRIDFSEAARPTWKFAHQVQRADFDARVRQAALDAGARLIVAKVQGFDPPCARTDKGIVRGRRVIDALGREGVLAKQLGLRTYHSQLRNAARTMWFEGVRHFPPEKVGDIVIACFDGGWFWFIPFANGVTSVGSVTTKDSGIKGDWEASLARCPSARERLAGAVPVSEMRGLQDFSASSDRYFGDGWALCGDAAVFIDPIFSSGVLLGLECAAGLSEAILGQRCWPATWCGRQRRARWRLGSGLSRSSWIARHRAAYASTQREVRMPKAWTAKDERMYEHIKDSSLERGMPEKKAKEIAGRTVNKNRREEGRTPNERTQGTGNPNLGLEERTVDELRNLAKERKIKGYSRMRKAQLVAALRG